MKRITSFLLTLALVVAAPLTAIAATAPSKGYEPTASTNKGAWSYVEVTPIGGRSSKTAYVYSNYQTTTPPIEGVVSKVDGLSYSKKTNTLTMKNYKDEEMMLLIHNMGTGFTINLSGKNQVRCITVDNENWDSGLTIKGSGSITLGNKSDHSRVPLSVSGKLEILGGEIKCLAEVTDVQSVIGLRYSIFASDAKKYPLQTALKYKGTLDGTRAVDTGVYLVSSKDDVTFKGKAISAKPSVKRSGKKVSWSKKSGYQYQVKTGSKITTTKKTSVKSSKKVQVRLVKIKDGIAKVGAWSKKV